MDIFVKYLLQRLFLLYKLPIKENHTIFTVILTWFVLQIAYLSYHNYSKKRNQFKLQQIILKKKSNDQPEPWFLAQW